MSEKHFETPVCDNHPIDVAQALCKYHKTLVCFSCALEKAKSSECSVIEINKISGDQDTVLYQGLLLRQIAIKKKRLIEKHERKAEEVKNDLKKQVNDFHEKLIMRLNMTKHDCLSLLEKHAVAAVNKYKHSEQQINSLMSVIDDNLVKCSAKSGFDLSETETKFKEVKKTLLNEVPDVESIPEGNFTANEDLEDTLLKSRFILGHVHLISQTHYAQVGNNTDIRVERNCENVTDTEENNEGVCENVTDTKKNNDCVYQQQSTYTSSDEASYSTTATDKGRQAIEKASVGKDSAKESKDNVDRKQELEVVGEGASSKDILSQDAKKNKKRKGFSKLFRWRKSHFEIHDNDIETDSNLHDIKEGTSKQNVAQNFGEVMYQDLCLYTREYNQLRNLINKTVAIDGMQQHFMPACKFSKLVYLGSGYLGLLSKGYESVGLTSIDGTLHAKRTIQGLSDIVASGKEQVAAIKIVEKTLQVIKYKVSNKKFETVGDFFVNADVPRITGFDFDANSSTFAVSLPGKLVIFKTGKIEREASFPMGSTSATGEAVTLYDFRKDCIYLLDSLNKTLKCFSFANNELLWKSRIDESVARNVCLYEDKLCMTCRNTICIFNAKDGKTALKHNTHDLLDDCDGICVIDGVIVFSSNSSDSDTSNKLAFISM